MTVKIEDRDCIFTSHKFYPKYIRYEKLGNYLQLLTVIFTIIAVIVYVISEGLTWSI